MNTANALILAKVQTEQIPFGVPPNSKRQSLVTTIKRGSFRIVAHYTGDLAVSGQVDWFKFDAMPLDEVFAGFIIAFLAEIKKIQAATADDGVRTEKLLELYRRFCQHGRDLHRIAATSVCSDGSRFTTSAGMCINFTYTLTHICKTLVSGSPTTNEPFISIDTNFGGLETWDGLGIDWGFEPSTSISRVQRTDVSRDCRFHAASEGCAKSAQRHRARWETLMSFAEKGPESFDPSTPNSVFHPIADAIRGTPGSTAKVIASAINALRQAVLDADAKSKERDDV